MAWFRCFIRGENFPGQMIGESGPVGFYVTRFVEATDSGEVETAALRVLRAEPQLAPPQGYTPSGRARVFFEAVEELAAGPVPRVQPGFAWHTMEIADAGPATAPDLLPPTSDP
ncbi:MAG: hypothetical protein JWO38_4098 [Gemmataceae bacterium]|nr:hypothetical protein [Gemmataceae bacterium]